jgi:hypothetical protein
MTKLAGLFTLALGAAILSAAACGSDEGDEGGPPPRTPAEQFCDALATYIDDCGPKNPCDEALLADCADVTGMLNDGYLLAAATCMTEGNAPMKCLTDSLGAIEASSAHHDLAKKVCDECAFGLDGCEDAFFAEGDGETQLVGKLVLPFGDSLVNEIAAECAQGLTCIPQFPTCVQGILAERALPTETLACLISPPPSDDTPKCETISGGSGDPGTGGSGASGNPSGSASGGSGSGGGTGSGGNGSGSGGGYDGTCPATTATFDDCTGCCVDERQSSYQEWLVALVDECACKIGSVCNSVCAGICVEGGDVPEACSNCLGEQVDGDGNCSDTAFDGCMADGSCAPFYACVAACGSTCTFDVECPSEYICEGGVCTKP